MYRTIFKVEASLISFWGATFICAANDLMESKGGKKKSSSSSSSKSLFYEAPLGYSIEDVRPHGGIKKFRSAAYSNVCSYVLHCHVCFSMSSVCWLMTNIFFLSSTTVRSKAILSSAEFRLPCAPRSLVSL